MRPSSPRSSRPSAAWIGTLCSDPQLTVASVADAVLPCFGPAGLAAADGIALFMALADLGVIRPDPDPIQDGQTQGSEQTGGRWQR